MTTIKSIWKPGIVLMVLALAAVALATAAARTMGDETPATKPVARVNGWITKIDGAVLTIDMRRRGTEPATILTNGNTQVQIDGEDKKVADLKEGMFVQVFGPDGQPAKAIHARTKIPGA